MKFSNLKYTLLLTLCLFLPSLAFAAENTHRQQVETLFRLTQMEKKVDESVDNLVQVQLSQNPALAQHKGEIHAFFQKHIGWGALKNDIAQMYIDTFSEKELKQINDFYITPTGQKVINILPQLVQQRNQLAMQRLQKNIGELQSIIEQTGRPQAK